MKPKVNVSVHKFRVHRSGLLFLLILFEGNQILGETSYGIAGASSVIIYILIGVPRFGLTSEPLNAEPVNGYN